MEIPQSARIRTIGYFLKGLLLPLIISLSATLAYIIWRKYDQSCRCSILHSMYISITILTLISFQTGEGVICQRSWRLGFSGHSDGRYVTSCGTGRRRRAHPIWRRRRAGGKGQAPNVRVSPGTSQLRSGHVPLSPPSTHRHRHLCRDGWWWWSGWPRVFPSPQNTCPIRRGGWRPGGQDDGAYSDQEPSPKSGAE